MQSHMSDSVQTIMSSWLPLAPCVLDTVCALVPSPVRMTDERADRLLVSTTAPSTSQQDASQADARDRLRRALVDNTVDAPTLVFVSKMVAVERKSLPSSTVSNMANTPVSRIGVEGEVDSTEIQRRRNLAADRRRRMDEQEQEDANHEQEVGFIQFTMCIQIEV
jgi:ribosome assembly protein 1